MTGLDPGKDKIIQIVCFVTNWDLSLMDEKGWECVISRPAELLESMDEWCTRTHAETGLTERVKKSNLSSSEAAEQLLDYIKHYVPDKNVGLLCGNSVHADKLFMKDEFKIVLDHLHYRIGDVSSIKEFAIRWSQDDVLDNVPQKKYTHEARQDILESIEEARYWANTIFRGPGMNTLPFRDGLIDKKRREQSEESKHALEVYQA